MADRGIIFSAPMVSALLAGRKSQTRRLLSQARVFGTPDRPAFTLRGEELARALQGADRFRHLGFNQWFWESDAFDWQAPATRTGWMASIGHAPGDRLYVRESLGWNRDGDNRFFYRADKADVPVDQIPSGYSIHNTHAPAIHMPRWASRLTLLVTDVRVQRLGDMSEADAMAEGIYAVGGRNGWSADGENWFASPKIAFHNLWDSLHTDPGTRWEDNPFIYAVNFEVRHGNIDNLEGVN